MNQYILLAILLVAVLAFWTFIRTSGGLKISPEEAKKKLDYESGIILLDVRTRGEYIEKHIPKSILIPLDILADEASRKLPDKNCEIFVYCLGGSRSAKAVMTLLRLGYTRVYNLGGITSWPYETVSGDR